jgi:hypothetical protein
MPHPPTLHGARVRLDSVERDSGPLNSLATRGWAWHGKICRVKTAYGQGGRVLNPDYTVFDAAFQLQLIHLG